MASDSERKASTIPASTRRLLSRNRGLRFTVEGYKAVRDSQELYLAPLTVIAGVNSSGKSSFMQPFLLMKQTLDSAFDPGPLLLHGPNVKITERSQIFSRGKSRADSVDQFSVRLATKRSSREVTYSGGGNALEIKSDVSVIDDRSIARYPNLTDSQASALREVYRERAESYVDLFSQDTGPPEPSWKPAVTRNRCFLDVEINVQVEQDAFHIPLSGWGLVNEDDWVSILRGIIHVPGLRGNPERSYPRSATGATFPGTFEKYMASLVYEWSERAPSKLTALAKDLESLGLTWKVLARRLNDASIELLVGRMPHAQQGGAHDVVSVADVGFGVSQTLPVLVALHVAKPGQIVYIEQPEIHLHPRAQLALSRILVEAANRGVIVVTETHSSLVIRGLQTHVARGRISPKNISMNWFSRDLETGFQNVVVADLDSKGRLGDWPLDFDEIARDADWAYLDAVGFED